MIKQLIPLHSTLNLNRKLFINSLAEVDEQTAIKQPKIHMNNIAFLAIHLLDARFYLAEYLGYNIDNPYKEKYENVKRVNEVDEFPPMENILKEWNKISDQLNNFFNEITEEKINKNSDVEFQVEDKSVLGGITYLLQHESYHIGHIGLLRKYFGFDKSIYS